METSLERFTAVLKEATECLFREMVTSRKGKRLPVGFPSSWDINNGLCEEWGQFVQKRVPDAVAAWLDEFDSEKYDAAGDSHFVVKFRGKFYDAECHEGVGSIDDLPFRRNSGKRREEVLRESPRSGHAEQVELGRGGVPGL